jgi:plasmid stabilization system protein ParE
MMLFRFTPEASADLFEIWNYIAADSEESADRVECDLRRLHLVYNPTTAPLRIIRILHGKRNLKRILASN